MTFLNFWQGKKVFLTGHTGFKGSWLSLWLASMGASVTGFALAPPTNPSLFELANISSVVDSVIGDIRDFPVLKSAILKAEPQIVFHLAAQPLVVESYKHPIETYQTNVMGTVHLFEALRSCESVRSIVNVTSDKCYENQEWVWGYRENEPLGGYDPYSSSKACSELVTSAYRASFFNPDEYEKHSKTIATARAGNVVGGGDWARHRLVPDCVRALLAVEIISVHNPVAIRPWQHVLEPLKGYLSLAENLFESGVQYSGVWNFGPDDCSAKPVEWIVKKLCEKWGGQAAYQVVADHGYHEAGYLKLDSSKAKSLLNWHPKWNLDQSLDKIVEWSMGYRDKKDLAKLCLQQIEEYATLS